MDTGRSAITWLQYYQAVKRGDLDTVKKAPHKDFRIPLSADKSAIQLAALYGHQKLVNYFLESVEEEKEKQTLCNRALNESLRGGHFKLSKHLLNLLGLDVKDVSKRRENRGLINAAIEGRNLACLELMWQFSSVDEDRLRYATSAFSSGSLDLMNSVYEFSVPSLRKPYYGGFVIPPVYIHVALGRYKRGMKLVLNDKVSKHQIYSDDGRSPENFTLLDAAGYFGHLDILRLQIEEFNESKRCIESQLQSTLKFSCMDSQLQSVLKFALRNDHINVVKYLVEERLVTPRPPYEYEGFNINSTFEYLQDITCNIAMNGISECLWNNIEDRLHVLPNGGHVLIRTRGSGDSISYLNEDKSARRFTKIEEYYDYLLETCSNELSELDIEGLFMKALSEQNVDAALCFLKRVSNVGCHSPKYHEHFAIALSASHHWFDYSASPVVVELLLSTLNGGLRCACPQRLDPLLKFLRGPGWDEVEAHSGQMPNCQPFPEDGPNYSMESSARYAGVVLELLFNHGIPKPKSKVITRFLKQIFAWRYLSSATAGKILALLECCKVNLCEINVRLVHPLWYLRHWHGIDDFLTYLLVVLSRNTMKGRIALDYLLMYIFDSPRLKGHYFNVFRSTGLLVDDSQFGQAGPARKQYLLEEEIRDFKTSLSECLDRVPSLQEIARRKINHHLLDVAHRSAVYVSVKSLIEEITLDLPRNLREYMKYSDLLLTIPKVGYYEGEISRIASNSQHSDYIKNLYPVEEDSNTSEESETVEEDDSEEDGGSFGDDDCEENEDKESGDHDDGDDSDGAESQIGNEDVYDDNDSEGGHKGSGSDDVGYVESDGGCEEDNDESEGDSEIISMSGEDSDAEQLYLL